VFQRPAWRRADGGAGVAKLALEKFGGDSLREFKRNYDGYVEQVEST